MAGCGGTDPDPAEAAAGGDHSSSSQQQTGDAPEASVDGGTSPVVRPGPSSDDGATAPGSDGGATSDPDGAADADGDDADASDIGSVTVTIGSGPLAGTHTGTGTLKCSAGIFGGDEHWIVFSTDIEDTNDVTVINGFSAPEDQKDNPSSPYQGQAFLLEVGTGNFLVDSSKMVSIGDDAPGTQGERSIDGTTMRMSGTTADGVEVAVEAHCPSIDTTPAAGGDLGGGTPSADGQASDPADPADGATDGATDVPPASPAFCDALAVLSGMNGAEQVSDADIARATEALGTLMDEWPAETKPLAQPYFDAMEDFFETGEEVDLGTASPELGEAFGIVLNYTMAACPTGS